ncbi:antigen 5 like allergen Cul n 1-like [Calliphora vicina]|uniref:antigen 5 like allergen Cul n 1-like n=1 Tax=Calliphora vicina TaxID=7373 RepID=UPI00325BD758
MKVIKLIFLVIVFLNPSKSWEYCQADVQNKLCGGGQAHLLCDGKNSITNPSYISKDFLAHVPLTRKVKEAFINWHNYYRNRTAGGWAKNSLNSIYFPMAVRMRELLWDSELSFLSHYRSKLVNAGEATCRGSQRFPYVAQNLIVKALNEPKPVLEIISLSLREMFDEKNNIENPTEMPKEFMYDYEVAKQFTTMINDGVSRVGCAVALGADCMDKYDT